MSDYGYDMVDFDCPVCGDTADERGCINDCDFDVAEHVAGEAESHVPEDAAMEMHLWGEC